MFNEAEKATGGPDPISEVAEVKIGTIRLQFRKNDSGGTHYLGRVHTEEYHNPIYRLLGDVLSPAVCIDIGANYGYTGLLMQRAFPRARLTLVEPIPWLEAYIRHNFALNSASFAQFHSAICSTVSSTGISQFGVQDKGTQDSRVVPQRGATTIDTRVVTLEALCADIAPDEGVYIKIDTQGWEERVFSGGEAFLSTHQRWFSKIEFAPQWLESQGTDPVVFLEWLLDRFAVHESVGRVRYNCQTLDEAIGRPLAPGCELDFVTYVRDLALNDRGWVDLYVLPLPDRREFLTRPDAPKLHSQRP